MNETMNFGDALLALKRGERVSRLGWNGKGLWLCMVTDWDGNFGGSLGPAWSVRPFIAIKSADDSMVPWAASQTDALAEDWFVEDGDGE